MQHTPESDTSLPISGLQHLAFCPRQWALIHLEQAWAENRLTAEGRLLHERADLPGASRRGELRTVRGLALASVRLNLHGRADIVEFRPGPFPVEYKRGKRKPMPDFEVAAHDRNCPGVCQAMVFAPVFRGLCVAPSLTYRQACGGSCTVLCGNAMNRHNVGWSSARTFAAAIFWSVAAFGVAPIAGAQTAHFSAAVLALAPSQFSYPYGVTDKQRNLLRVHCE